MSSSTISCIDRLPLPDFPRHLILEYLDYKLRNKKYIKQLSKYQIVCFEENFSERPEVLYFDDDFYDEEIENEYGNDEFYTYGRYEIQFYIKFKKYHDLGIDKLVVLSYSPFDRNEFDIRNKYLEYDFDGKHCEEYFPDTPW